jgi:hypothetical protein
MSDGPSGPVIRPDFHKRLNVIAFLGYSSSMTLPIGRPPNRQTMADRTARIAMVGECTKAFPKVMKFWLEALEGTATYRQNGQEFFKYSVADQFEAAKYIMEYGYGRPVQPLVGAFQEQRRQIPEVRWMPPDPNDRSRAVDLKPGGVKGEVL